MLTRRKKIIILSSMLALLVVTAVLNVVLSNNNLAGDQPAAGGYANNFAQFRSQRFTQRSQAILFYNSILADPNVSAQLRTDAERNKLLLIAAGEKELIVEAMIRARGFDDVIVTHTTGAINVIVRDLNFTQDRMQIVFDIIMQNIPNATEDILTITPVSQ
ncbi:MAG: SpoIIIAH-like family protein [Firmicutes bacterium]|nr:SpoIIIAH-like family protein [Bacillota bacterium]